MPYTALDYVLWAWYVPAVPFAIGAAGVWTVAHRLMNEDPSRTAFSALAWTFATAVASVAAGLWYGIDVLYALTSACDPSVSLVFEAWEGTQAVATSAVVAGAIPIASLAALGWVASRRAV